MKDFIGILILLLLVVLTVPVTAVDNLELSENRVESVVTVDSVMGFNILIPTVKINEGCFSSAFILQPVMIKTEQYNNRLNRLFPSCKESANKDNVFLAFF
jgi:hypothetical protein